MFPMQKSEISESESLSLLSFLIFSGRASSDVTGLDQFARDAATLDCKIVLMGTDRSLARRNRRRVTRKSKSLTRSPSNQKSNMQPRFSFKQTTLEWLVVQPLMQHHIVSCHLLVLRLYTGMRLTNWQLADFSGNGNSASHFHFGPDVLSASMGMAYDQTESSGPTTGRNSDSTSDSPVQSLPFAKTEPEYNAEAGPSSTAMLTPNTEAILQQFLNLPTPVMEQTLNFPQSQMSDQTMTGALAKYTNNDQFGAPMQDVWSNNLLLEPPIPMYNAPSLLPTGLNLFGPSSVPFGGDPSDMQRFLSTLTGDAVAYHLSLPANGRTKGLENGMTSNISDSQPFISASAEEEIPPTGLADFPSASLFGNEGDAPKKSKEPIDVPPFVKEKLLRVYLDSLRRCPAFYVNRERLFKRLKGPAEDRPHPSWLFSMVSGSHIALTYDSPRPFSFLQYLEGTRWVEDPALRNMEAHFYNVSREYFESGLSKTDRALDLTRTAINLALYMMRSDKEGESTMMAMHGVS